MNFDFNNFFEPVQIGTNINVLRTSTHLESYKINQQNEDTIENSENLTRVCSICQENYSDGTIIRKINNCSHFYHQNCLDEWLESHTKCPECQYDLRTSSQQNTNQTNQTTEDTENIENIENI